MRATFFEFRHRVAIITMIYTVGLAMFWSFPGGSATGQTTWLTVSSLLASSHSMSLSTATLFVTIIALCCGIAGTALRVWGTAHLGAAAMTAGDMLAHQVVVSGPYGHLRNPLYAGTWLLTFPIILLMPVAGALFVLIVLSIFLLRIIGGEEAHLATQLGESYRAYRESVPRLFPAPTSRLPQPDVRPRWTEALLAEAFAVGYTFCFALLAWRYNAQLLMRCLLVCFGVSLILKALIKPRLPQT